MRRCRQATQIYTRVSIKKLKEIHTVTHPGARLERRERSAEASADEHAPAYDPASQDDLLSASAAEAAEEEGR